MSMVQELIAAVGNSERQIDEQVAKLNSYKGEIDRVAERIEAALSGSQQFYNKQMLDQLSATKNQVETTLNSLQAAKDKLSRVRMI